MADHRPTRHTVAGRAYLDLQNLARHLRRPTDELHQMYALEGFLARLASSAHADRLVLKGGVLLAAYDTRRPTRDIDLHASRTSNDVQVLLRLVQEIAARPLDDGVTLDPASATTETIRDDDQYNGARVTLTGRISVARITFHVDINVGDPVLPAPRRITLPKVLGGHLELVGYPLPMILAEKIVTALQRGTANTRWRDFADIYALCRLHPADGHELHQSLTTVATHRRVALAPLSTVLDGYADLVQPGWVAWRRRQRLDDRLPQDFAEVLHVVFLFADPILRGDAGDQGWRPRALTWQ